MEKTLKEIQKNLNNDKEYNSLKSELDKMIYEFHYFINELLNPVNAYDYEKETKNRYTFVTKHDIKYFVTIVYQPTKTPYFEMKFGWIDKKYSWVFMLVFFPQFFTSYLIQELLTYSR